MIILAVDPGESTGWVIFEDSASSPDFFTGGTVKHDRRATWELLDKWNPDVLVFESFKLYATHAQSLIGNKFYTCEIIGILKLYADIAPEVVLIEQGATIKRYSGAKLSDPEYQEIKTYGQNVTEHTFDAYMHLKYYRKMQNGGKHAVR